MAIQYRHWAALDGVTAKGEAARDKILGSEQYAQELGEKCAEIPEII